MAAIKKTKGKITNGEFSPLGSDQLRRRPLFIFNQRGSLIKLIISSEGGMMLALCNIIDILHARDSTCMKRQGSVAPRDYAPRPY